METKFVTVVLSDDTGGNDYFFLFAYLDFPFFSNGHESIAYFFNANIFGTDNTSNHYQLLAS